MVGDCYKNHLPCLALQASKNKTCSFSWFNLTNLCHRILSHVQVSISSRWSACGTALCGLFSILRRTSPWSPPSLMAAKGKSLTHCHVLSIKLWLWCKKMGLFSKHWHLIKWKFQYNLQHCSLCSRLYGGLFWSYVRSNSRAKGFKTWFVEIILLDEFRLGIWCI